MDILTFEIDALRQKLELMISHNKTDLLSEKTIMECSQKLDDLITLYYKQMSKSPENTNKFQV
jgi:hypothetical protein